MKKRKKKNVKNELDYRFDVSVVSLVHVRGFQFIKRIEN